MLRTGAGFETRHPGCPLHSTKDQKWFKRTIQMASIAVATIWI